MLDYLSHFLPYVAILVGLVALVEALKARRRLRQFRRCDKSKCASMVQQAIVRRETMRPPKPPPRPQSEPVPLPPAALTRRQFEAMLDRFPSDKRGDVIRVVFGDTWQADSTFWGDLAAMQRATAVLEQLAAGLTLEDRQRAGDELRARSADIMQGRVHGSLLRYMGRMQDDAAVDEVEEVG